MSSPTALLLKKKITKLEIAVATAAPCTPIRYINKKFKTIEKEDNYILMKKRRYGNLLIHAICLVTALFFIGIVIFINVAYVYAYFR